MTEIWKNPHGKNGGLLGAMNDKNKNVAYDYMGNKHEFAVIKPDLFVIKGMLGGVTHKAGGRDDCVTRQVEGSKNYRDKLYVVCDLLMQL